MCSHNGINHNTEIIPENHYIIILILITGMFQWILNPLKNCLKPYNKDIMINMESYDIKSYY